MEVKLSTFENTTFDKKTNKIKWFIWLLVSALFLKPSWIPFMALKIIILKFFGATIGKGLVIKPSVNIKFPWKLTIGNNVWIGENVWIDNLDKVTIGDNVCISQGALLLTGNHDYTLPTFDYKNAPISLEDGVWLGAKSVVCPGVICKSHSILGVGSIATKNLEPYTICQGNPAKEVRKRIFKQ
jgi:putative colanic acid biosynthesis acetyltransferase WcaF